MFHCMLEIKLKQLHYLDVEEEAIIGCHQSPEEAGGQKPSTDCSNFVFIFYFIDYFIPKLGNSFLHSHTHTNTHKQWRGDERRGCHTCHGARRAVWGVGALLKGTSAMPRMWNSILQLLAHIVLFFFGLNRRPLSPKAKSLRTELLPPTLSVSVSTVRSTLNTAGPPAWTPRRTPLPDPTAWQKLSQIC